MIPQFFDIEVWASTLLISFFAPYYLCNFHVILYRANRPLSFAQKFIDLSLYCANRSLSFAQKFIDLSDRNSRSTYYLLRYTCSFHHEYYFVYLLCYTCSFHQKFINLSYRNSRSTYFVYFVLLSFKFFLLILYFIYVYS